MSTFDPRKQGHLTRRKPKTNRKVAYRNGIAYIESRGSGNYNAIGPRHKKLGRALGRYQVMEANVGPWSRAALGRTVSVKEFMASPKVQDTIFDHRFGGYVKRFGEAGAAQAWFAGEGGVGKVNRKDSLGTSVGVYGAKFMKALAREGIDQPIAYKNVPSTRGTGEGGGGPAGRSRDRAILEANEFNTNVGNDLMRQFNDSYTGISGSLSDNGFDFTSFVLNEHNENMEKLKETSLIAAPNAMLPDEEKDRG